MKFKPHSKDKQAKKIIIAYHYKKDYLNLYSLNVKLKCKFKTLNSRYFFKKGYI